MGKMMDFHTHRRILAILSEMQETLSEEGRHGGARNPKEFLGFFAQLEQSCRAHVFGQAHYGKLLERLSGILGKAARKGRLPVKKELGRCREMLKELAAGLEKEKNIKKGIVFLPYLASMWDCMESVWQAAARDTEHCNAYVIPIPYCSRNEDGTAKEWLFDGDRFPKDLPLLPWEKTDLRKWHPDIIVIHNPYEDCSLVNTVEPRYYPSVLRRCTDKLVYIPYFIFGSGALKDPKLRQVRGLARTAGMWHSDAIILHSKEEKEAYIKALEGWRTPEYWQSHILALGSPKVDKLNRAKDPEDLPPSWDGIIRGRKVVLYNTSVKELLLHREAYLAKIRDTLAYFRSREGVVLWWRPHPLLRDTVGYLMPEALPEYDGMVQSYRKEGWGIYDDTADMHRSLIWSDAYYGDASSVAVLYSMTGRPMLAQNAKVRNCQEGKP